MKPNSLLSFETNRKFASQRLNRVHRAFNMNFSTQEEATGGTPEPLSAGAKIDVKGAANRELCISLRKALKINKR